MEHQPDRKGQISLATWIKLGLVVLFLVLCLVDWDGDGLPGVNIMRFILTH